MKQTGLIALVLAAGLLDSASAQDSWRQWGGPDRNFIVDTTGLADSWPEAGPPILWSRPLGTGHSSIVTDDGRLFTMYRVGNGRERGGPFDAEENVIAMDATTGATLWTHSYPAKIEDFNFGAGPHSTPLIVGDRLFTIGTNKQLYAFDTRTGDVLWSHDLINDFGSPSLLIRPIVKAGYGCSPIAFEDNIICSVGGPGQSVMSFRQDDGTVVWKSGDFLTSQVPPVLIEVADRPQLVIVGGGTVNGLDPKSGELLWSHPHDPGNDLNCSTPLWGPDNVLVVSSAYKAGSRALRLTQKSGATMPEELWFTQRSRFMFLSAVRLGDYVYGTSCYGQGFLRFARKLHQDEIRLRIQVVLGRAEQRPISPLRFYFSGAKPPPLIQTGVSPPRRWLPRLRRHGRRRAFLVARAGDRSFHDRRIQLDG